MRVAYLGPPGTFSQEALLAAPGASAWEALPQPSVYDAVLAGLRAQPSLVDPIVAAATGAEAGLAAAARSFIRAVGVGASAYGEQPPPAAPAAAVEPPVTPAPPVEPTPPPASQPPP